MTKQMTLLEKAKLSKRAIKRMYFTAEDIELVSAWLQGEIGLEAVRSAKDIKSGAAVYSYLSMCCREIWQNMK